MAVQVGEQAARRGARASRAELVELFTRTAPIAVAAAQDTDFGDFPSFRRVYAHDPFGNRLEFLEPSQ